MSGKRQALFAMLMSVCVAHSLGTSHGRAQDASPAAVPVDPLGDRREALVALRDASMALLRGEQTAKSPEAILVAARPAFDRAAASEGLTASDLTRLRAEYTQLVTRIEDELLDAAIEAQGAGRTAPSGAASVACLVRVLHVDDTQWGDADTDAITRAAASDAAKTGLERFLLEQHRPLTAFSVASRRTTPPDGLAPYVLNYAARLSLMDKKALALAGLQAGAARLREAGHARDAAPLRARAAELLADIGTAMSAAGEVEAALRDATDEQFGRWSVQHVKYVYAAGDDARVVTLARSYLEDKRCEAWTPHLLYAAWGAMLRSQVEDAGAGYFEKLMDAYPDHPLTAEACFGQGNAALARGDGDGVARIVAHLRARFPKHEKTRRFEELIAKHMPR